MGVDPWAGVMASLFCALLPGKRDFGGQAALHENLLAAEINPTRPVTLPQDFRCFSAGSLRRSDVNDGGGGRSV
jgi:hypothetical protein